MKKFVDSLSIEEKQILLSLLLNKNSHSIIDENNENIRHDNWVKELNEISTKNSILPSKQNLRQQI